MMTVAIVDDSEINVLLFKKMLGVLEGCSPVGFTVSQAALDWAVSNEVDLVLVDYTMPAPDGLAFIERFRRIPGRFDVPVVMVTTSDNAEVRYKALELGATDFLMRPVDRVEFLTRVRNMLTLRRSARQLADRAQWLAEEVRKATRQMVEQEREAVLRLSKAAEYRDPETGAHLLRISIISRLIGQRMGLDGRALDVLAAAAPMHDVGKVGIPDHVLLKPGRLTPDEFEVMKRHTVIGYEILGGSTSPLLQAAADIALSHHERFDGSGYPRGLAGEAIPPMARIVAVADVFDALISDRVYKPAWPQEEAEAYLREGAGSHFDPACVEAFFVARSDILATSRECRDSVPC